MRLRPVPALPFTCVLLKEPMQRYRCPRDWNWNVRLNDYDLWIAFQGRGELVIDGRPLEVVAPQAVLLRPGEHVRGYHQAATPLEVISWHFMPQGKVTEQAWAERMRTVPLHSVEFFREAAEHLLAEHRRGDGAGNQAARALAVVLLAAMWRQVHTPAVAAGDNRLEMLVRQIQRDPERKWTVSLLAKKAAMGTTGLNQAFRRLTGCAPMAWVIRCRLARAMWLLRETDLKLSAVAEACGYRDSYFFSRQFRRFLGMAPGAWRHSAHSAPQAKRDRRG
jgi:AraC-like DNA-binding protein/mannose-6-phosphate isomerase-like protein (cupin superfamily)